MVMKWESMNSKLKSECLGLGFCFVGMSFVLCVLCSLIFFQVFFFFFGLLEHSYNGDGNCFNLDFHFYCLGIGFCCG